MNRKKLYFILCFFVLVFALFMAIFCYWKKWNDEQILKQQQQMMKESKEKAETEPDDGSVSSDEPQEDYEPVILPEYQDLYEQNQDLAGWLKIEGTNIDYPVMQTPENEDYYLDRGFDKSENINGCLILDTDSNAGIGDLEHKYEKGTSPSANLIIHGHTMKSGKMFGNLKLYEDESYGLEHHTIRFDSLYEHREYELIAVFYSQVFYEDQDVFKYYKFFQADTKEEFDDWYHNIKDMSLYDTGVTAEFGDEFITLSCCAYHVEDGRFVVVGKRTKVN